MPFAEQVHELSEQANALRAESKKAVDAAEKREKKIQEEYDRRLAELTDILTIFKEASWLYEKFGDGACADIPGLCKAADTTEIEAKGFMLRPVRLLLISSLLFSRRTSTKCRKGRSQSHVSINFLHIIT